RQVLRHFLLCTAQRLRLNKPTQTLQRNAITLRPGLNWSLIFTTKLIQAAQKTWLNKIKQTPQVDQRVLYGGTRTSHTESRRNSLCSLSNQRGWILNLLRLIANHNRPLLHGQGELLVTQRLVGGKHDTGI